MGRTGELFTLYSNPNVPRGNNTDIQLVTEILQNRSVSVPSDEPLLIGTLLNLDVAKILQAKSPATRMRQLWMLMPNALHGVPPSVIFWIGPRLGIPGFRWAPASLLHSHPDNVPFNMIETVDHRCEISPHGLRLRLRGCVFNCQKRTGILGQVGKDLIRSNKMEFIYVSCEDGTWLSLMTRLTTNAECQPAAGSFHSAILESRMWLLQSSGKRLMSESGEQYANPYPIGLLAKEVGHEGNVKVVRSMCHVGFRPVTGTLLRILQAAHKASKTVLQGNTAQALSRDDNWTYIHNVDDARAKMQHLLEEVEHLVDAFDQDLIDYIKQIEKEGISSLVKQVYHFALGMYGCLSGETTETQEWIVD